jgi:plastocyanin
VLLYTLIFKAKKTVANHYSPITKGANMQKKNIFMIIVGIIVCCVFSASVYAEEVKGKIQPTLDIKAHQLIRLNYLAGISPADVTVQAGTTVIWMNDARAMVQLQFEGQQVTMACKSPVNFIVDDKGSFISNLIPQGSVASLCFVEKGTYNYVFRKAPQGSTYQTRESIKEYKGMITVE